MAIIKLQFETPQDFSKFKNKVKGDILESNIAELTLVLRCTEEIPAMAIRNLNAKLISSTPV